MQALELSATVSAERTLVLDRPLPVGAHGRVRLLVLFDEAAPANQDEAEWLAAAAASSTFAFLHDPAEDIYSREDGAAVPDAA